MLSTRENELLTRVGPGTPMGEVMRRYWIPLLFSSELTENDGTPLRTRVLGEDLVAFRDSNGEVGMIADACPHRGASLFFGRNEDAGLRCVYHGWKFDVSGACTDMPNEPAESNFKHKIRAKAYPCTERNGVIWLYMGPDVNTPGCPEHEWNMVPQDQVYLSKRVATNNWVQALEGEIDPTHGPFLHSKITRGPGEEEESQRYIRFYDRAPALETLDTEYGVAVASRRDAGERGYYYRINQFVLPFYTVVPPSGHRNITISGHAWIPIDDENVLALCFTYSPTTPLSERLLEGLRNGGDGGRREPGHLSLTGALPATSRPHGAFYPKYNWSNDFGLDPELQKEWFSGLPGIWPQDSGCQETMGRVNDRTREHLGIGDTGIIRMRRRLLQLARSLRDQGIEPPSVRNPSAFHVRSVGILVDKDRSWLDDAWIHSYDRGDFSYAVP